MKKDDLNSKLKRMVTEPKVFSLLVTSARGQILYIGVHFSLEEAYSAAREKMEGFTKHKPGEAIDIDLWNTLPARHVIAQLIEPSEIDKVFPLPKNTPRTQTDSALPLTEIENVIDFMDELVGKAASKNIPIVSGKDTGPTPEEKQHTVNEHIQDVKKTRNNLMKKLIADGDIEQLEKVGDLLSTSSRKYVRAAIEKRKNIIKDNESKQ